MPDNLSSLVSALASMPSVRAVGVTGHGISTETPDGGDVDIFVYCSRLPEREERTAAFTRLQPLAEEVEIEALDGGHFGHGDYLLLNGVDTWALYFTIAGAGEELDDILQGKFPDKVDNYFYPIGRCAMYQNMTPLYDPDGVIASFQKKVAEYPPRLALEILQYHLEGLRDVEDLERAAARGDVLFYHFALDLALDHFLQALFALNQVFFPSRKRSFLFIRQFTRKPADCEARLMNIVAWGGRPETLAQSLRALGELSAELGKLV